MRKNFLVALMIAICFASVEVIIALCNDIKELKRTIAKKDEMIAEQEDEIERLEEIEERVIDFG